MIASQKEQQSAVHASAPANVRRPPKTGLTQSELADWTGLLSQTTLRTNIGDGLDRLSMRLATDNSLAAGGQEFHARLMFAVSEEEAAAIRTAFERDGEFAAAVELRRRFPGITDNGKARQCARAIAGWTPLRLPPRPPVEFRRLRKRSSREG
jgi:hypothetical protein